MKLPNKLIVVGMRYQPRDVQRQYKEYLAMRIKGSVRVNLVLEENPEGIIVDGKHKAYAVYMDMAATPLNLGTKIGYIRNKDIPLLDMKHNVLDRYIVTDKHDNYLVLEYNDTGSMNKYFNVDGRITSTSTFNDNTITSNTLDQFAARNSQSNTPITEKKETKMNTSSMRDSFFREVKNVVIDIQSGKFGVTSKDGIATFANGVVNVNPMVDFGVKIPAFAMRVELTALKEGDIIINGDESTFFKALTDNGYEVVTLGGEVRQVGSVSNMFFSKNTVLAVKNMFGEGTNPMMMAMLMGDGFGSSSGGDNKNMMLMMMAMSGGMGGAADSTGIGGMNPMMLAMLMSK